MRLRQQAERWRHRYRGLHCTCTLQALGNKQNACEDCRTMFIQYIKSTPLKATVLHDSKF